MKIAYILFNGITWLDFFGIYDPLTRLQSLKFVPRLRWDLCSFTEKVTDNFGLQVVPTKVRDWTGSGLLKTYRSKYQYVPAV